MIAKYEPPIPTTFTPFFRRFTDEGALEQKQTQALYDEVRAYAVPDPLDTVLAVSEFIEAHPLRDVLMATCEKVVRMERWIFEPINHDLSKLNVREMITLRDLMRRKQYFHANSEDILEYLKQALVRIFCDIQDGLPQSETPSPFTIPLICVFPDAKIDVQRLHNTIMESQYEDRGLFVDLRERMYRNVCAASNLVPHEPPKRPYKVASESTLSFEEVNDTYLGQTPFHALFQSPVALKLTIEDRFSHMHIVGGTNAGKTQLLQHLILNDLRSEASPALVIVDSQTDLIQKILHLDLFNPDGGKLADKLIYISPRDIKFPPALNIFDVNRERLSQYDEGTKEQVVAGVIQTFDYLFTGLLGADLTAKQSVFFRFVARLMLTLPETIGRNATILDLIELMDNAAPYMTAIERLPPIQRNFFERDFLNPKNTTFKQTKEQIRYRLNAILENPTLARLFTSPKTKIDLFTALNNNAIILVDTAKDFLKGSSSHFGRIFISLVLQAVLERAAIPEHERKPAFLIVDEAAAYFDSNIDDLLTEARKYKLGCVFAHQFLDQCTNSLKSSLAANTSIKMASGVSMSDARALAPDLRTTPDFILSQPKLHFAAHIRNVTPQAVSIPVPVGVLEGQPRLSDEAYQKLREMNRLRVSLPPDISGDGFSMNEKDSGGNAVAQESLDDPSKPSPEW